MYSCTDHAASCVVNLASPYALNSFQPFHFFLYLDYLDAKSRHHIISNFEISYLKYNSYKKESVNKVNVTHLDTNQKFINVKYLVCAHIPLIVSLMF